VSEEEQEGVALAMASWHRNMAMERSRKASPSPRQVGATDRFITPLFRDTTIAPVHPSRDPPVGSKRTEGGDEDDAQKTQAGRQRRAPPEDTAPCSSAQGNVVTNVSRLRFYALAFFIRRVAGGSLAVASPARMPASMHARPDPVPSPHLTPRRRARRAPRPRTPPAYLRDSKFKATIRRRR
jgi:hypothetical protein